MEAANQASLRSVGSHVKDVEQTLLRPVNHFHLRYHKQRPDATSVQASLVFSARGRSSSETPKDRTNDTTGVTFRVRKVESRQLMAAPNFSQFGLNFTVAACITLHGVCNGNPTDGPER